MARYEISLTMLATVTIDADSPAAAIAEAVRFAEASGPQDSYFADGWNSAQPEGAPRIVDMSGPDVEAPTLDDVEEIETPATCRADDCDANPDDGDGYDGYCGSCADAREPE